MKKNKLITVIAGCCSAILLITGSLLAFLPENTNSAQGSAANNGETQSSSADMPTPTPRPADAQIVSDESFMSPEMKYRALRIAHDFSTLPGGTSEKQAQKLIEYGFGGVITNDGWDNNYLQNDRKLERLDSFIQAVHDAGLRVWIYDEKGYPSGTAGDLVVAADSSFQATEVLQQTISGSGKGSVDIPKYFVKPLFAFVSTDSKNYTRCELKEEGDKLTFDAPDGAWDARVYSVVHYAKRTDEYATTYPNILNREAVKKFIEITYETYGNAITNFSDIVEAFFDDEATLTATRNQGTGNDSNPAIPYDEGLFEGFEKIYGVKLEEHLPELFSDTSAFAKRLRAQYFEYIGTLVSENFFGQINEWCEAHGAKGSGHLLLEEQMFYHIPIYGDYIRASLAMGYPGFDILNPRPVPYMNGISTGAKYASSAAWLDNKERVFVEICPVDNPQEFATNHLDYALSTMTFTYFDGGNQVATYYVQANTEKETGVAFNEYISRMGSMTVGAQNKTKIAVYYPIDTVGANYRMPNDQSVYSADELMKNTDYLVNSLTMSLREKGLDYVFLDDGSLQKGTVNADGLKVNSFTFSTVIVPAAEIMDIETLRVLDKLSKQGTNVIFINTLPLLAMKESDQAELQQLTEGLKDALCRKEQFTDKITTSVPLTVESNATVFVSPWEKNGQEFYFLANASDDTAHITLHYEGITKYRLYDPVTGTVSVTDAGKADINAYRALFVQPIFE